MKQMKRRPMTVRVACWDSPVIACADHIWSIFVQCCHFRIWRWSMIAAMNMCHNTYRCQDLPFTRLHNYHIYISSRTWIITYTGSHDFVLWHMHIVTYKYCHVCVLSRHVCIAAYTDLIVPFQEVMWYDGAQTTSPLWKKVGSWSLSLFTAILF